ncbi:MAG: YdcF family protein [Deltaproteobacteria bacterium]|nr:YdcF family protein [Deltaproteobacteria bacterium]
MILINIIKIITQILLPPGLIVLLLLLSAYAFYKKGMKTAAYINFILGLLMYVLFIEPVQDYFYRELEEGLTLGTNINGDVVIVLGGGVYENSPDLNGNTVPSDEALARIVMAYRLHKRLDIPIITTGGRIAKSDHTEADVAKRYLIELGVREDKIITERVSRTTKENAEYTSKILKENGFKRPILVTTAYHMKRAILNFKKYGIQVIPAPCSFRAINRTDYKPFNYIPGPANPFPPLKELLGILYLELELFLKKGLAEGSIAK